VYAHKPVSGQLFFYAFQAQLREYRVAVYQMDFDVLVLAFDVFYIGKLDAD
jgi:hypothetical protein